MKRVSLIPLHTYPAAYELQDENDSGILETFSSHRVQVSSPVSEHVLLPGWIPCGLVLHLAFPPESGTLPKFSHDGALDTNPTVVTVCFRAPRWLFTIPCTCSLASREGSTDITDLGLDAWQRMRRGATSIMSSVSRY